MRCFSVNPLMSYPGKEINSLNYRVVFNVYMSASIVEQLSTEMIRCISVIEKYWCGPEYHFILHLIFKLVVFAI